MAKKYADSDGAIYTLAEIKKLNKSDGQLTAEDLNELSEMEIGNKFYTDMDFEYFERIE